MYTKVHTQENAKDGDIFTYACILEIAVDREIRYYIQSTCKHYMICLLTALELGCAQIEKALFPANSSSVCFDDYHELCHVPFCC